jgi:hypothetical protein
VISFKLSIAREIAKDLLRGDSCSSILEETKIELKYAYNKISYQSDIISDMQVKDSLYEKTINLDQQKYNFLNNHTKSLEIQIQKDDFLKKVYKYGFLGSDSLLLLNFVFTNK